MDLPTLADYAEVLAGAAILVGGAFALLQYRSARLERREQASMGFMQSMLQAPRIQDAIRTVWWLPEGLTAEEFRAKGRDAEDAAIAVIWTLENVGLLVHERVVDLATVDRLIGGFVRDSWRKLSPYVENERRRLGTQNFGEWFQWLAETLERHGDVRKGEGAHVEYRDWRP
ncbi:MAG: DUF4760 domain-containing protein [Methanobacteriota archaeon]